MAACASNTTYGGPVGSGAVEGLARNRVNVNKVITHWQERCASTGEGRGPPARDE